jgi:predicted membrane chloride channel (bestrophin family)
VVAVGATLSIDFSIMIVYSSDYFGLLTLLNLNGSAAYRAFLPALFSTVMLVVYKFTWGGGLEGSALNLTAHPYVITIYVMAFSLVLNFRLNYSYQRYWESASQLFMMTSKWVDAAAVLASFHYQAEIYRPYRPDPFGEELNKKREKSDPASSANKNPTRRHRTVSDMDPSTLWEPSSLNENHGIQEEATHQENVSHSTHETIGQTAGEDSRFFSRLFGGWSGTDTSELDALLEHTDKNTTPSSQQGNSLINTKRPTYHRRIPSVDLPRPGTAKVKSFHPTHAKDWETTARTSRLSHMHSRTKPEVDVESWLSGRSSTSPSTAAHSKYHHHHHHRNHHHDVERRASLPSPKRSTAKSGRSDSEAEETSIVDNIHSNGIASERGYRYESTGSSSATGHASGSDRSHPPAPPQTTRRSAGILASFLPFHWGTPPTRSKSSMSDELSNPDPLSDHDWVLSEVDEDDTSATNSSRTENFQLMPSLFLQEAAHLFSLTSAVAMASLRADMEGCASPLVEYIPGQPFPPVNPDEMKVKVWLESSEQETEESAEKQGSKSSNLNQRVDDDASVFKSEGSFSKPSLPNKLNNRYWIRNNQLRNSVYFLLGLSRSPRQRTLYNASRPFAVMGGLSDNEVELLQKARGPEAQMALCMLWLKELIIREHLDGSTGEVAPPIVARIYQHISDGFLQYNQCRKTAYTQFPFVHTQLTTFFLVVSIFLFPFLFYTYVNNVWLACFLNFASLACFDGMIEVAREMQDPFYQFPNDLPLNNYQVQYNEALISCMYGGFHPDAQQGNTKKYDDS